MRLLEYEQQIKDKLTKNLFDETIYEDLQNMIYMFLRRKKVGNCPKDVEDISYLIAGDLYTKLLNGFSVSYFLGYLEKVYKSYLREFYGERSLEVPYDLSLDNNKLLLNNSSIYQYTHINNKIYLERITSVIKKLMNSCKYKPTTNIYLNLELSLILSILRNEITLFHLTEEHRADLKLLLIRFYTEIVNNGFDMDYNVYIEGVSQCD